MKYACICSKCNYSWSSSTKPDECPNSNCKNKGITYREEKEYNCSDCKHNWSSSVEPNKCPHCKSNDITCYDD